MVMDASLLRYDEFRSFLVEAVSRVARKQYPESKSLDAVVRYVESEVKEPGFAEFLINKNVYAYVAQVKYFKRIFSISLISSDNPA